MDFYNRFPLWEDRLGRDLFRALSPFLGAVSHRHAGVFPPVNIFDDGEAFLVRAEIPGLDKDTIDVSVKGDQLTIGGERLLGSVDGASYHRRECEGGKFSRTVTLPQHIDADKISASYKNGLLEVTLPRVPEMKPRKIDIN